MSENNSFEMSKHYTPQQVEDKWYAKWEQAECFHSQIDADKKPYTIVIPPPNVTGKLHMGHALNNTLQDIMIRAKRMQGKKCAVATRNRSCRYCDSKCC